MRSCNLAHLRLIAGVLGVFAATSALAQSSGVVTTMELSPTQELLTDRFVIDLGAFIVSSKVNGSLRGDANPNGGDRIDFDKVFGTDADATRVRAAVLWRMTKRQSLRFAYFDDSVTRTRTIDQDINWGDYTFLANAAVTARTKFSIYEASYEFSFLNKPNYKVAVVAGVHVDDFSIGLAGDATVTLPDGTVQTGSYQSKNSSVTAPLPVLGLRGDWAVTDHIYLEGSAEVFKFSYEGIDGNWSVVWAGASWMFSHHFGIGIAYDRFQTNVDLSKGSFNGRLNLGYQGAVLYIKGGF